MRTKFNCLRSFILLWMTLLASQSFANLTGIDVTYSCNPQNPCLVTFSVVNYQDCATNPILNNTPMTITAPPGCPVVPSIVTNWTTLPMTELPPLCPWQVTSCHGGTALGIRVIRRSITYNLCNASGTICSNYAASWYTCCRPHDVNALVLPEDTYLGWSSNLQITPKVCNSSPVFNGPPVFSICQNQPTTVSMQATDPDGNTLQYLLAPCLHEPPTLVTYQPGFGATTPLGGGWNVALNGGNGSITFTPSAGVGPILNGVVCVQVNELNAQGVVIGSVLRDMEVHVRDCSNELPSLSGQTVYTGCIGQQICISGVTTDPNECDIVTVNVLNNTTGGTVNIVGSPRPTVNMCFTPTAAGTYSLILEVRDNANPNGVRTYVYTFTISNCSDPCSQISINPSFTHTESMLTTTVTNTSTVTPTGLGPIFTKFIWGDGNNATYSGNYTSPVAHTYAMPGTYNVCMVIEAYVGDVCCHDTLCQEVVINPDPCDQINIVPSFTHVEGQLQTTVTNTSTVTPPGGVIFTRFTWGDLSPATVFSGNYHTPVTHTYAAAGTYNVCVVIEAYVGDVCCHDSICERITIVDDPCSFQQAHFTAMANLSPPCSYTFWDNSSPASSTNYWDFGDGSPLATGSPVTHTFATGTWTITLTSIYHPPGHPEICCTSVYQETYRIDCRGRGGIGKMAAPKVSVVYDDGESSCEIALTETLLEGAPVQVSVFDITGKLLFVSRLDKQQQHRLSLPSLSKGVYFARFEGATAIETTRFIVR